jgi:3-oxoacyl-[acyl-carrier protein] reductase
VKSLEGKAAVEQFCRVLGRELAPRGITVNVVSPGFTRTRMLNDLLPDAERGPLVAMTPFQRLGDPEDIADVVAFLAGDGARWMTRQNLAVDGGIVTR